MNTVFWFDSQKCGNILSAVGAQISELTVKRLLSYVRIIF